MKTLTRIALLCVSLLPLATGCVASGEIEELPGDAELVGEDQQELSLYSVLGNFKGPKTGKSYPVYYGVMGDNGSHCTNDGINAASCNGTNRTGLRWQCVEWAVRFMHFEWGTSKPWGVGAAKEMCSTHPSSVRTIARSAVKPGDLFVSGDSAPYCGFVNGQCAYGAKPNCNCNAGHVAVVKQTNADGSVVTFDQNRSCGSTNCAAATVPASAAKCWLRASAADTFWASSGGTGTGSGSGGTDDDDQLDLDGDGRSDIFRYDPSNGRVIVTNMTSSLTSFSNKYDSGNGAWAKNWENHFADLDGDGDTEIFRYSGAGRVVITRLNASLTGLLANAYDGTGWGSEITMSLADLNGDGRAEVLRYDPAGGTLIVTQFSTSLASFSNKYAGGGWGVDWQIHTADLNGDGKRELVRYNGAGRLIVTQLSSDLQSFSNKYDGTGWGSGVVLSFADLNGDGAQEIVRYTPNTGALIVTRFSSALTSFSNEYAGGGWGSGWQISSADLNGDGKDELVRYSGSGRVIVTQFSASLESFSNKYDGTGWGTGTKFGFGDLNGDGSQEVFRYSPTATVTVTRFSSSLASFSNTYSGGGWGTGWQIFVR